MVDWENLGWGNSAFDVADLLVRQNIWTLRFGLGLHPTTPKSWVIHRWLKHRFIYEES